MNGDKLSGSSSSCFNAIESDPGKKWLEGWVVLRACTDAVVKKKSPCSHRGSIPGYPAPFVLLVVYEHNFKRTELKHGLVNVVLI
jgi:hypothetical protein